MADNFLGEIRIVPFNFNPRGWALCDGQALPISQNVALFSLLGTTYGGDGFTTFCLPNLIGRVSVGQGQGPGLSEYVPGDSGGVEQVPLSTGEIPSHNHLVGATAGAGSTTDPRSGVFASANVNPRFGKVYGSTHNTTAAPQTIENGPSNAHENRAPSLAMNAIIAVTGIFPSRN